MKKSYYVATRTFEFRDSYTGRQEYVAGMSHVAEDAEVFQAHPENFTPVRARESAGLTQLARMAARGEVSESALRDAGIGIESGSANEAPASRSSRSNHPADPSRGAALRAIESRHRDLSAFEGDRLVGLVRSDSLGIDSEYIAAVADPAYERAFAKQMMGAVSGVPPVFDVDEQRSLERVNMAVMKQRALNVGTPAAGGYAVPLTIDPTIMLSSAGATNPMRSLATVTEVTSNEWQGVSSAGATASFDAEAAEVSDDTPTLAGPAVPTQKAQAFVPYTIELSQDWPTLLQELFGVLNDSKDVLEASKFILGAGEGSNEPEGLIAGLDSASIIETANSNTLAVDDAYALEEALPPRFQANASWISSLTIANKLHRTTGGGGSTEPPLFNDDRTVMSGKPWHEVSSMVGTLGDNDKILLYGDIAKAYRIVDRVGMSVEIVQHLLGSNRRPNGMRGLYAYWRVGGGVVVDNAVRLLKVKA